MRAQQHAILLVSCLFDVRSSSTIVVIFLDRHVCFLVLATAPACADRDYVGALQISWTGNFNIGLMRP